MSYKKHMRPRAMAVGQSSKGYASASSSSSYNSKSQDPFGPGMAESIFNLYDLDFDECVEDIHDGYYPQGELDPEDLYNGETQSFHFRYQETLDLETNEEREARLKNAIRRFEQAYRVMSVYALKWHYLQEDLEDHEDLKKMFRDIQMLRKLKGSDFV